MSRTGIDASIARAPSWAWSVAMLLAASFVSMALMLVYFVSWEADRTDLEEHRALSFAQAVAKVSADHGPYYTQRFVEHLSQSDVGLREAFVIADGGVDEFGISRGQTYTATIVRAERHRVLSALKDSTRHKTRADRFSRATAGFRTKSLPNRASESFVLERDAMNGMVWWSSQVPVVKPGLEGAAKASGSAGASLRAAIPEAPLPWGMVLLMTLGGWAVSALLFWFAKPLLGTPARRSAAFCIVFSLCIALSAASLSSNYTESLRPHVERRAHDFERVHQALEYAQIRGENAGEVLAFCDVKFTGEPGRFFGAHNPSITGLAGVVDEQVLLQSNTARTLFWLVVGVLGLLLLGAHRFVVRLVVASRENPYAYLYIAPSMVGMVVLVFVPFATGIGLSVFDNDARRYYFVGAQNFAEILRPDEAGQVSFYWTLFSTLLWTVTNVVLHVSIGLALALVLRDSTLKFRRVYRVLLIVPWAIPNYITALIWKGMFNKEFGAVNQWLELVGIGSVDWLGGGFATAFTANLVTNTWLGFPFMMVVSLGALQSIPASLYEAAEVDGATPWQKFRHITLPLLKPALFPAVILGTIWTFNMFNVIYLVSGGGPNHSTEILITDAYRAFAVLDRHGLAAAYSVIIFVILFLYTTITNRITRATEGAFE